MVNNDKSSLFWRRKSVKTLRNIKKIWHRSIFNIEYIFWKKQTSVPSVVYFRLSLDILITIYLIRFDLLQYICPTWNSEVTTSTQKANDSTRLNCYSQNVTLYTCKFIGFFCSILTLYSYSYHFYLLFCINGFI